MIIASHHLLFFGGLKSHNFHIWTLFICASKYWSFYWVFQLRSGLNWGWAKWEWNMKLSHPNSSWPLTRCDRTSGRLPSRKQSLQHTGLGCDGLCACLLLHSIKGGRRSGFVSGMTSPVLEKMKAVKPSHIILTLYRRFKEETSLRLHFIQIPTLTQCIYPPRHGLPECFGDKLEERTSPQGSC